MPSLRDFSGLSGTSSGCEFVFFISQGSLRLPPHNRLPNSRQCYIDNSKSFTLKHSGKKAKKNTPHHSKTPVFISLCAPRLAQPILKHVVATAQSMLDPAAWAGPWLLWVSREGLGPSASFGSLSLAKNRGVFHWFRCFCSFFLTRGTPFDQLVW